MIGANHTGRRPLWSQRPPVVGSGPTKISTSTFTRNNAKDDILIIEGEQIPYIDLRDLLEDSTNRPIIPSLVMIRFQQTKVGILIDHIIGEHQAVVKSLGTLFRKVQSISGATILGDGEIALILDVNKIITEYVTLTNLKKEVLI